MNEHYRPTPGTPMEDLDTPCLVIDMDDLDSNMDVIADTYRDRPLNYEDTPKITKRQR